MSFFITIYTRGLLSLPEILDEISKACGSDLLFLYILNFLCFIHVFLKVLFQANKTKLDKIRRKNKERKKET